MLSLWRSWNMSEAGNMACLLACGVLTSPIVAFSHLGLAVLLHEHTSLSIDAAAILGMITWLIAGFTQGVAFADYHGTLLQDREVDRIRQRMMGNQ